MPEPYIPNEKQIIAHCATEQFIGYGGAMGGGKSRFICEMAKLLSIKFPGNLGVIARQSGPALRLSTQEVFFDETLVPGSKEWQELGCKFSKSEGILTLTALDPVSKIWFTGLDSDNIERIKSLNLGFFCLDEATEIAEVIFMMLCTRLRRKGIPKEFRKGIVTANPEAGWVKRRFLDQRLSNHIFVGANFKDNPHLPEDYPQLFDHMPRHWIDRYLFGNWGAVTGLIYKDFDEKRHVVGCRHPDHMPGFKLFRSLDHGQQNPACCMGFAYGYPDKVQLEALIGEEAIEQMPEKFDAYPVIFVYRMYYSSGLVSEHRKAIRDMWYDVQRPGITLADPSIFRKDREKIMADGKPRDACLADEYQEQPYPLRGLTRANNEVLAGINRVSTLFKIGHLYIMDDESLQPLIGDKGEIRSYSWKYPRTEDEDWPEEPVKANDHACDALRYGVMKLPPPRVETGTVIPFNSFHAARQRAILDKKRKRGIAIRGGKVRIG